ncbi:MAG: hypothetical protein GY953_56805, partial [bacterium]|nr:hypothetical protein [bacterium]
VVVFAAAAALILNLPEEYAAELRLMVRRARAELPVDARGGFAGGASSDLSEAQLTSEIELFRNRNSLEQAVRHTGLVNAVPDVVTSEGARVAMAVREMDRRLAVYRVEKSNLIQVSYSHRDPKLAAQVVRTLTDTYLAKHMEVHRNQDAADFFNKQSGLHKRGLDAAQQELAGFRMRHQVSSLEAEKAGALARKNELERILQATNSEIRNAQNRVARLRAQVASLPETIETSSRTARSEALVERLKASLLDLENKRTELLTKYEPGYRLLTEIDRKIQDTKAMLEQEGKTRVVDRTHSVNPLRQGLEGDLLRTESTLFGLEAKRSATARDLAKVGGELIELERITAEHDDLVRDVKVAEDRYLLYTKRLEESQLEDAMDRQRILNVSVVEDAEVPAVPVEQHQPALMVLSAIMAMCGSLALAFAVDLIRPPAAAIPEAGDELVRRRVLDFTGTDERVAQEPAIDEEEPIPVAEIYQQEP